MKKNSILQELLIGIFAIGIFAQIVCLFFFENIFYHSVGLWVGIVISVGMAIHMKYSIEDGLDLAGDAGAKHMKKAYLLRTAIVCVLIAIVLYFKWGNPITILVGIMALKISVYFQPIIGRIIEKKQKGG